MYLHPVFILQATSLYTEAALSGNKADDGPHTNRPKGEGEKEAFHLKIKLLTVMTPNQVLLGRHITSVRSVKLFSFSFLSFFISSAML